MNLMTFSRPARLVDTVVRIVRLRYGRG
jgi:hypothetical protein